MYDVIIIGRGPAGLSAAIYLCRAGRKVLVIGEENQIWKDSVKINNFFAAGEITGRKLMEKGQKQAEGFGAKVINGLVTKVEAEDESFKVFSEKNYDCKNLIIATGSAKKMSEISNEKNYVGKGVSYCVSCDGFFFKNKKVFVVGNTSFALAEAEDLLDYTKDVTIVTNGKKPEFKTKKFKIEEYKIEKIMGEKLVDSVKTSKGTVKVDGLFIAAGNASANDLAKMLGVIIEADKVKADEDMKTNVPFVWAAGDCTKGLGQVSTAVSKGVVAAASIIKEGRK
ncbi:MAG: NAD(P)/FAD-dependent oxidoreductase [Nanoarchaeota archaeon]|nr:NAD(P)/FAD-dependent oxidoreductase [Nanoarchaeota archaeon]